jgi:hypothetical protein
MFNYKSIFRTSPFLNFILIIVGRVYFKISYLARFKRQKLNLEDFQNISNQFLVLPVSTHWDNDLYGIGFNLLLYAKSTKPEIACFIEHGYYFGSYVSKNTFLHNNKTVMTFGKSREDKLINNNPSAKIIKIGPYIHYAKSILKTSEVHLQKKKYGKSMLVFIDHSTKDLQLYHNDEKLIKQIKNLVNSHNIKTVLICLYWKDIKMGIHKNYEKAGFKIVCSGYRDDIFFLARLRSLIEISDLTASNSVGTHVPYCLTLEKPHILIDDSKIGNVKDIYTKGEGISDQVYYNRLSEIEEVENILRQSHDPIELKSNKILNSYFGFSEIKSPSELSDLINNI